MIQETLVVGPFQCNCCILACEETKEAVVIDAGDEYDAISKRLRALGLTVKYSLHTHAHLDHIGAVHGLKAEYAAAKIALHADDADIYRMLPQQGQMFGFHYDAPPAIDVMLQDGQEISFGRHKCQVIHTPGHSPGGACFHFSGGELGTAPFLFSGDTLFHESIGRTDLWGGDFGTLKKSIQGRLFTLEEETAVQPGHGPRTSVGHERRKNPFVGDRVQ